jgi:hypothetical protein
MGIASLIDVHQSFAPMSEMGQKARRAHVFRFGPESGLKTDIAGGPVRASSGSRHAHSITAGKAIVPLKTASGARRYP